MEKDIKALVANQKNWKEEMKNHNAVLKKEIKDEVVLALKIKLGDKLNIMNEKQKELYDKMIMMKIKGKIEKNGEGHQVPRR